ncbi:AraC family transcriptional regulator [Roseivirga sp. E12]|uniref:AraC family transcriptional regulator n=1 Tax=Roseivirga sp. E12 TaxID=2819237 RepID=UPI001ABBE57C|nr:AraC family transcriptional regulator [Roseivirga sp. E12]MBO3699405.1 helix-turn-helix domain-containing protein [Roseivirga sp. E12]
MKPLPFKIPKTEQVSFHTQIDEEKYFYDTLHQHPEIQVTLIEESHGTLIYGDYLGSFEPGDVFVIGPNAPHVFRNDASYYTSGSEKRAKALTFFFDRNTLGASFLDLPEAKGLAGLIEEAGRGMKFSGKNIELLREKTRSLFKLKELDRIIALIEVLKDLSINDDFDYLSGQLFTKKVNEIEGKRLNDIFNFTMLEYSRPIQLVEVAEVANMTKTAFCRYFKQHTRKTYLDFLNEYRVGQACKMLTERDKPIAQIAFECGFNNLSNFNRRFKVVKGVPPTIWSNLFD